MHLSIAKSKNIEQISKKNDNKNDRYSHDENKHTKKKIEIT
jgi:hypothetical protein